MITLWEAVYTHKGYRKTLNNTQQHFLCNEKFLQRSTVLNSLIHRVSKPCIFNRIVGLRNCTLLNDDMIQKVVPETR